jgi:hypothetical protein
VASSPSIRAQSSEIKVHLAVIREFKCCSEDLNIVDSIKLLIDKWLMYRCYIYLQLFEEGKLTQPQDICSLAIIKKMNDPAYSICRCFQLFIIS